MSLEVLQIAVNGNQRWRCANENSGMFSLDEQTIEPFVASPDEAIGRLYVTLLKMKEDEVSDGPKYIAEMKEHISNLANYRRGACIYDLDGFFSAVNEVRTTGLATRLSLTQPEVEFLKSMDAAIREEVLGNQAWVKLTERLDPELEEKIYLKFFPDYDLKRGVIPHSSLNPRLVNSIESGFRYISLLRGTLELAGSPTIG
jgi:hypothetical protein